MSDSKRYIITINEPCNEAWGKMSPRDCGRFCSACNKVVHDLTGFNEAALQKWAGEQKGPVCGRLHSGQLYKPTGVRASLKDQRLYKMAAAFLATTSLSSILSLHAQNTSGKSSFKTEQGPASLKPVSPVGDSLKFRVHGFISDSMSEKPLAGVSILIDNKVMGITGADGYYSFVMPGPYRKPIVKITAAKMDSHQPVTDIMRLKNLPVELDFALAAYECKSSAIISAGIVVIKPFDDKNKKIPDRIPWYRRILLNKPGGLRHQ